MVVEFGAEIDPDLNSLVHRTTAAIERAQLDGVVELVPTYRSITLHFDPTLTRYETLQQAILDLNLDGGGASGSRRLVEIPTLYGGEYGPGHWVRGGERGDVGIGGYRDTFGYGLLVYAMGFSPGFPYLGGLDPRLNTPRLSDSENADSGRIGGNRGDTDGRLSGGESGGLAAHRQDAAEVVRSRIGPAGGYQRGGQGAIRSVVG